MRLIRTREEQLEGLARWYRRDGQTACAEAIEWALAELAQRDVMLTEAMAREDTLRQSCAQLGAEIVRLEAALRGDAGPGICPEVQPIRAALAGSPDAWRG